MANTITICPPPSSKKSYNVTLLRTWLCEGNRDGSRSEPSQHCEVNAPVEVKVYVCTTKKEEMNHHLATWGIQILKFSYEFSIVEGSRLHRGRVLKLEEVLTVRNIFHYYLADISPNGWRQDDDENGDQEGSASPFMITVGVNNRLVGDANTTCVVEESSRNQQVYPGRLTNTWTFDLLCKICKEVLLVLLLRKEAQVALAEAGMVSVGISEGSSEEKVRRMDSKNAHQSTMETLERAC
ncbi:hypothetical protein J1N35_025408 [Gossypium stocksii]|uniref:Uncharacterized protein n=1 Tax=Gossypium stocksii TaxID=47602 RepID=A0A9D3ZW64_9ROSI|nr:hypothetical protein J1N35_025408 [Gossypium stocksii]